MTATGEGPLVRAPGEGAGPLRPGFLLFTSIPRVRGCETPAPPSGPGARPRDEPRPVPPAAAPLDRRDRRRRLGAGGDRAMPADGLSRGRSGRCIPRAAEIGGSGVSTGLSALPAVAGCRLCRGEPAGDGRRWSASWRRWARAARSALPRGFAEAEAEDAEGAGLQAALVDGGGRHADPRAELLRLHQCARRRACCGPISTGCVRVERGVAILTQ